LTYPERQTMQPANTRALIKNETVSANVLFIPRSLETAYLSRFGFFG